MNLQTKLRSLNQTGHRLKKLKRRLLVEVGKEKALAAKLEKLVKEIGLPPRDLVFTLVDKYKVRLAGRRKGQRRRRKRTKITPELCAAVKKRVKSGVSMNRASQEFGLSYAVVIKMMRGHYDKRK
jgi:hypothetical protein